MIRIRNRTNVTHFVFKAFKNKYKTVLFFNRVILYFYVLKDSEPGLEQKRNISFL